MLFLILITRLGLKKEKMERFDYQHLDGLALESELCALRIDYSEPDQGGTRLMIAFRFYLDGRIEEISGYVQDRVHRTKAIGREKIPPRVLSDCSAWLQEQERLAGARLNLKDILGRFERLLTDQKAQPTAGASGLPAAQP